MRTTLSRRSIVVLSMSSTVALACSTGRDVPDSADASTTALASSDGARLLLRAIDARFRSVVPSIDGPELPTRATVPIVAPTAAAFFASAGGLRASVPGSRVEVTLPDVARGPVRLRSGAHAMAFTLEGASGAAIELADGLAVFRAAGPGGADLVHRVDADGTEDHLVFAEAPARPEVRYRVELGTLAGLRLIDGVLELLDRDGAPRFRMRAPWLVDATGARLEARVEVEGCAVDRDPRAPWGRPPVAPGATACVVRIGWPETLSYPALLDPTWTATTNTMSTTRAWHAAERLASGKVLLAGGAYMAGAATTYVASADLYDPTSKTFASTGAMTTARARHASVVLSDGKVLVSGGSNGAGGLATAETYDPVGGTWTATSPMAADRTRHQAVLLSSGKVLVAGGAAAGVPVSTAELFDPATRSFSATGTMTMPRRDFQMFAIDGGKVLAAMGFANKWPDVTLTQAEAYEPLTGVWSAAGTSSPDRSLHAGAKLKDGRILVAGGYSVGYSNNIQNASIFAPSTGTWSTTGSMSTRRQQFTMTTLDNGAVLVAGGVNADRDGSAPTTYFSTAELFTGSGFTSTSMPGMGFARYAHTATLLGDGSVLVAGGNSALGALGTAELFALSENGQACSSATMCKSGQCIDGTCCNTACTTGCYACTNALTGVSDGTCAPVKGGTDPKNSCKDDGAPTCLQNGLCDGAGACQKYPVSTGCTPEPCTTSAQCAKGYCVDGICCNSSCTGMCQACSAAKKGYGADGMCEPIKDGTDPENECAAMGTGAICTGDGVCNGSGACRASTSGTICAIAACVGNVANQEATCNPSGFCTPKGSTSCAPYACDTATAKCRTTCTGDGDCVAGTRCVSGACTAKANGAACTASTECTSGFCVDGLCCNAACTGQCEACDVPLSPGVCSIITGEPHGTRPKCAGAGDPTCGAKCDGTSRTSCRAPSSTTVCASSCLNATTASQRRCSGGTCSTSASSRSCSPYVCDALSGACKTACKADADCATGYSCVSGICRTPSSVGNCDGSSVIRSDGTRIECAPYDCNNGTCRTSCISGSQCAKDALCETTSKTCYYPAQGGGGGGDDGGGCGCAVAGPTTTNERLALAAFVAGTLGLVQARRRRRRSDSGRP